MKELKKLSGKKLEEVKTRIETEMALLFRYMDERNMPPGIGLSVLMSAMMTIAAELDFSLAPIIETMLRAEERSAGDEIRH